MMKISLFKQTLLLGCIMLPVSISDDTQNGAGQVNEEMKVIENMYNCMIDRWWRPKSCYAMCISPSEACTICCGEEEDGSSCKDTCDRFQEEVHFYLCSAHGTLCHLL